MTTAFFLRKPVVISAMAVVALAVGGAVWANSGDDEVGRNLDRVAEAAIRAAGGGTAMEVKRDDDSDESYTVEVRRTDGTMVEVALDDNLNVLRRQDEDADEHQTRDGLDDGDGRQITGSDRDAAEKAAVAAVGSGTATDVEADDDTDSTYKVDVRDAQGVDWEVALNSKFEVTTKNKEN